MPLPTPLFWRNVDSHTQPRWEGDNGGLEILGSSRPVFSGLRCHDKGSYGYLDTSGVQIASHAVPRNVFLKNH
jgi:hypothetical protein